MESSSQDISRCQDDNEDLQALLDFLVDERGFQQEDLLLNQTIETTFNNETVVSKIAVVIRLQDRPVLMIRYAPGSIVTRERSALAAARIYDPEYQVPLVMVTNNQDARMIDTYTGKVVVEGLEQLPDRSELLEKMEQFVFEPYANAKKIDREKRVLNVFDVNL
jgi:hypothetical protein